MRLSLAALLLGACPAETQNKDDAGDTAGVDDTADTSSCAIHVISLSPTDGAVGVYYRDAVYVSFDGNGAAAVVEVRDASGAAAALTATWDDDATLLTLTGALTPSATYTIHTALCDVTTETTFTTSSIGSPLTIPAADLTNRTFSFALRDAEIVEPPALEVLGDSSLVTPLGFMVQYADETQLELLGAVLDYNADGLEQVDETNTWDFPTADFTGAPYFSTSIDALTIVYETQTIAKIDIELYDFLFDGVISPDGSAIEYGHVDTIVDSRGLGPLLSLPDTDDSVCSFAADFDIDCIPCPDGEPYCIHMIGEDITAPWIEGLVLSPWPA
ncbi:MAG: hypothetical protein EXR71_06915 [Myxococcales bacterium]|nr:hypothetical protein [Myxococcales bacterium]